MKKKGFLVYSLGLFSPLLNGLITFGPTTVQLITAGSRARPRQPHLSREEKGRWGRGASTSWRACIQKCEAPTSSLTAQRSHSFLHGSHPSLETKSQLKRLEGNSESNSATFDHVVSLLSLFHNTGTAIPAFVKFPFARCMFSIWVVNVCFSSYSSVSRRQNDIVQRFTLQSDCCCPMTGMPNLFTVHISGSEDELYIFPLHSPCPFPSVSLCLSLRYGMCLVRMCFPGLQHPWEACLSCLSATRNFTMGLRFILSPFQWHTEALLPHGSPIAQCCDVLQHYRERYRQDSQCIVGIVPLPSAVP